MIDVWSATRKKRHGLMKRLVVHVEKGNEPKTE